ncbi:MAG: carboxypeptidase-like regulatory domain-containing protein [Bacteroidota bacterium]
MPAFSTWYLLACLLFLPILALGHPLEGVVLAQNGAILEAAEVQLPQLQLGTFTNPQGQFLFSSVSAGKWELLVVYPGFDSVMQELDIPQHKPLEIILREKEFYLSQVTIAEEESGFALQRLGEVHDMGIYAGKKTEVVQVAELTANLAANNSRQVFARVAFDRRRGFSVGH